MTQLRIDEVTPSKSGKAWRVRVGDKWYGASKETHVELLKGQVCEVEIKTTDFGPWMETVRPLKDAPSPSTRAPEALNGDMRFLPFASNTVAHAISAGLIKEPTEIKVWYLAAKQAVEGD